ncbi:MAG TPA: HNH endonuclease signature motif containing protein [Kofleriaceae bacterium]|jgi:hypothetical protein|nr:HNH endonuclease signature motif containing protein [Kofleriaceae bacterium]
MREGMNVPTMELEWTEIDRKLQGFARRRAALDAEELPWLLAAKRAGVHEHYGFATVLEYFERVLGYGPKAALERLRVAEAMEQLPEVAGALADGRLSYSAVREVTRVATPETAAAWIAATEDKTVKEVEELVSGRRPGDKPTDPERPDVRLRTVTFQITPATFAMLQQALRLLDDEHGERLDENEAVAALAAAVLAPAPTADKPARPAHQIATTICERCRRGWQDAGSRVVEISATTVEVACCDADHIGSLDNDEPGRVQRDIPDPIRRLIHRRFHGRCAVPGCRSARHLDVHHLCPRAAGGNHDPANLVYLCRAHHDRVHERRLIIRGQFPALVFTHADGRPYGRLLPHAGDASVGQPRGRTM